MTLVALVTCSGRKRNTAGPAAQVYQGTLFRASLAYAQSVADSTFILSAKHGLLHPAHIIEPYDLSLFAQSEGAQATWALSVFTELEKVSNPASDLYLILAKEPYFRFLAPLLGHAQTPFAGLGDQECLAWLRRKKEERKEVKIF